LATSDLRSLLWRPDEKIQARDRRHGHSDEDLDANQNEQKGKVNQGNVEHAPPDWYLLSVFFSNHL
jgi:hypothetical protein